jgi:hypothetical protein
MSADNPFSPQAPKGVFAGVSTRPPPGGALSVSNPFGAEPKPAEDAKDTEGAASRHPPGGALSASNPFTAANTKLAEGANPFATSVKPTPNVFGECGVSFTFAVPPAALAPTAAAAALAASPQQAPPQSEELKGAVVALELPEMKLFRFGPSTDAVAGENGWNEAGLGVLKVLVVPAEGCTVPAGASGKEAVPKKVQKALVTMRTVTMRPVLSCLVDDSMKIGAQQQMQVSLTTLTAAGPDGSAPPKAPQGFLVRATKSAPAGAVAHFVEVVNAIKAALVAHS